MGEDKPFTSATHSRIHAMCVQYHLGRARNPEGGAARFFLFIKNEYLMSFVHKQKREYEIRADPLDLDEDLKLPPIVMLWDQWGFHNSRFMAYEPQFRWLRFVSSVLLVRI